MSAAQQLARPPMSFYVTRDQMQALNRAARVIANSHDTVLAMHVYTVETTTDGWGACREYWVGPATAALPANVGAIRGTVVSAVEVALDQVKRARRHGHPYSVRDLPIR